MANVLFGLRKRGGITGIRELSVDSMGISWDEITEKRHLLLESLKNDMEKVFDELCEEKEFSCNDLELFEKRKSIICIPTLRTPGPSGKMATRLRKTHNQRKKHDTLFESSLEMEHETQAEIDTEQEDCSDTRTFVNSEQQRQSSRVLRTNKMVTQLHEIEAEPFQQEEQHDIRTEQEDCSDKRPFVNSEQQRQSSRVLRTNKMVTQLHEIEAEPFQQEEQHDIRTEQEDCSDKRPFVNSEQQRQSSRVLRTNKMVTQLHEIEAEPFQQEKHDIRTEQEDCSDKRPFVNSEQQRQSSRVLRTNKMVTQLHEIEVEPFQQEEQHDIRTEQEDCSDKRPFVNSEQQRQSSRVLRTNKMVTQLHEIEAEPFQQEEQHDIRTEQADCSDKRPFVNSEQQRQSSRVLRTNKMVTQLHEIEAEPFQQEEQHDIRTEQEDCSDKIPFVNSEQQQQSSRVLRTNDLKACFILVRNSPIKAVETQMVRKKKLAEKIAEKAQREDTRLKELEMKKEQERLDRIRKREERMKRIAENQAAILKGKNEKLNKLKEIKSTGKDKLQEKADRLLKVKERREAAEQRRLEREIQRQQKMKEIEEERLLVEELQRKRLQFEEEERQKKKQEKAEVERERQKRKEEIEKKKQEEKKIIYKPVKTGCKKRVDNHSEQECETDTLPKQLGDNGLNETFIKKSTCNEEVDKFKKGMTEMLSRLKQWESKVVIEPMTVSPPQQHNVSPQQQDVSPPLTNHHQSVQNIISSSISSSTVPLHDIPSTVPHISSTVPSQNIPSNKPVISSKYQNVSSYDITPMSQNPLLAADDYGIEDLESDHSTDDEDAPKKAVPMWAAPMNLFRTLQQQETDKMSSIHDIFPPEEVLQSPNLVKIFPKVRRRFFKRTSSAQWASPMLKK